MSVIEQSGIEKELNQGPTVPSMRLLIQSRINNEEVILPKIFLHLRYNTGQLVLKFLVDYKQITDGQSITHWSIGLGAITRDVGWTFLQS